MTTFRELIENWKPEFNNPDHLKAIELLNRKGGTQEDKETRFKMVLKLIKK